MNLRCYIVGDSVYSNFTVLIDPGKDVGDLRQSIKMADLRFKDSNAHLLRLYQVNVPARNLEDKLKHVNWSLPLDAAAKISVVDPDPDNVHVVVMPHNVVLRCLVLGDTPGDIFDISIPSDRDVISLKSAVKKERGIAGATKMRLFKLSLPIDDALPGKLADLDVNKLHELSSPFEEISQLLEYPFDNLRIVVFPPSFLLRCLVSGDTPAQFFNVRIPSNQDVAALKVLVKKEIPDRLQRDVTTFALYLADIPANTLPANQPVQVGKVAGQLLNGACEVSSVIPIPRENHIHIIVIPCDQAITHIQHGPSPIDISNNAMDVDATTVLVPDSRKRPRIEFSTADNITLHCVAVRGHSLSQIFPQRIKLADTVAILVRDIKSKLLLDFDATVQLFKVSLSEDEINQAREPEKIQGAKQLSFANQLSEFFGMPDKEVIHVVVIAPPVLPPSAPSTDFEHYSQLWKDLWRAPKGSPITYFERVPVERDGTCTDPELKVHAEAWTLQFTVDMARALWVPRGILLRDEMFEAIRFLMVKCAPGQKVTFRNESPTDGLVEDPELPQGNEEPGIVVIGQPGIGKSILLRVLFVLLLHAKWPVVFQYHPDFVVQASEDGVHFGRLSEVEPFIKQYSKEGRRVVALVDSTLKLVDPDPLYYIGSPPLFLVFAPSSREDPIAWRSKAPDICFYVLDTWNLGDLLAARSLQWAARPECGIVSIYHRFRPSPLDAYALTPEDYFERVQSAVSTLSLDSLRVIFGETNQRHYTDISHFILTMHPASSDSETAMNRTKPEFRISGPEIMEQLVERLKVQEDLNADAFYKMCARCLGTKPMAGLLLDNGIHSGLTAGGTWELQTASKSRIKGRQNQNYKGQ